MRGLFSSVTPRSLSKRSDSMDIDRISFAESYSSCICTMSMRGITLPHSRRFDPFGKLFAQERRCFRNWADIDVAASFAYDDANSTIVCNFFLSFAEGEAEENMAKFEKNAPIMVQTFEEMILAFLKSEFFEKYLRLVAVDAQRNDFVRLFNDFLKSVNLRTEKDDRRAAKEARLAKN